jgi:hypothetical protein
MKTRYELSNIYYSRKSKNKQARPSARLSVLIFITLERQLARAY